MHHVFLDYWRCSDDLGVILDSIDEGSLVSMIPTLPRDSEFRALPDDIDRCVRALRTERYIENAMDGSASGFRGKNTLHNLYYLFRPLLPVAVRKHLQRIALKGWDARPFPRWPTETLVDDLMFATWRLVLESAGVDRIPFIWLWPDNYRFAGMLTHDVETARGRDFCRELIGLEARFGVHSSFEIVPEDRYDVPNEFLDYVRDAGCEICLHGLNHDGHLFTSQEEFERRSRAIGVYAHRYGAHGFRSPIMYRQLEWIDKLPISYDMSVPNVAHLDPQRGGCCTVLPYFLDHVLELPLTTVQDYSLYHILREETATLWRQQLETIRSRHGLASFNLHPDYNLRLGRMSLYEELLSFLSEQQSQNGMWIALPGEIDRWWRQRGALQLVLEAGTWQIRGEGAERATIAWAVVGDDNKVRFQLGW